MDQSQINRIVEAALLASAQPLSVVQLDALFPLDSPAPEGSILKSLDELAAACEGRGVELVEVASGWRYQVKPDVHEWVARLWSERKTRYTRATLETLALIAYRQPITRGEIEQVRGVAVSSNIIQSLEEREWIRVVGHRDVPGRPALFGTTKAFLDYFGLKRLDDLPPLSELRDLAELEPELPLDDQVPVVAKVSAPEQDESAPPAEPNAPEDHDDSAAPTTIAANDDAPEPELKPELESIEPDTEPELLSPSPTDPPDGDTDLPMGEGLGRGPQEPS